MKQLYQTLLTFTRFSGLRQTFYRKLLIGTTLFFCLASVHAQTDEATADHALSVLQDVTVISKSVTYSPYLLEYQLSVKQPIDHTNPARGYFYQQVHLIHRGFSKPMVMETEGYDGQKGGNEIEKMLGCNDINVEFRYFNKSKPDSLQWQYLTFEQATADLHHINQVFRTLYHSKWISTGISRGGATALIYKYFFPKDVDAAIPYVAPMPNDIEDRRIYAYLETAGGVETANKIKNVQLFLLQHEKEILDKIPAWETKFHYTTLGGVGAAFEYAVLEYPFSFWQISNYTAKDIPTNNDLNTYFNHLSGTFSDSEIANVFGRVGCNALFAPCLYDLPDRLL